MKFDIALSYASEQGELAATMARMLQRSGYAVFFAPDELHNLLGNSLGITLANIYEHESRYCVILVSEDYVRKQPTRWEFKAALSRHARQHDEGYILPFRVDDTQLTGLPTDTVYGDLRKITPEEACSAIARRLDPSATPASQLEGFEVRQIHVPSPFWEQVGTLDIEPLGRLIVVLQKAVHTGPVFNLDCVLINRGTEPETIQSIQGRITDPNKTSYRLDWNLFYSMGQVMQKTGDARPVQLDASEELRTGIQFVGPPSLPDYLWPTGVYELELIGWRSKPSDHSKPAIQGAHRFEVTPDLANGLTYWRKASERDWELLNDPHDAVGIPLEVSRH